MHITKNQNNNRNLQNDNDNCGCIKITNPKENEYLNELKIIKGIAQPCNEIIITIDDNCDICTFSDDCGKFEVLNPYKLSEGEHTVCAESCSCCCKTCNTFNLNSGKIVVRPIALRMGKKFRTIDADVRIGGIAGTATVYYLLLLPESPTPTADEIKDYKKSELLANGTSATGQFDITITGEEKLYTMALTGLDKPNKTSGTTGVVDGYRYDAFMCIVYGDTTSDVLKFPLPAMGMPFDSGLGTSQAPFGIRELSSDEVKKYPDLIKGNTLNKPDVNETARMLENIERLFTLYEDTEGLYGLPNSLMLNYLMTSDIDLSGYAAAYNGDGWEAIGDIDGHINDTKKSEHRFSGVFSGDGHTIKNLSITPTASTNNFVAHRGLFGSVENGTIKNLTLSGVTVNAIATAPGHCEFASLAAIARNPIFDNLNLENATLSAKHNGSSADINIGGFVSEIFEGGKISNIVGTNISITISPDASHSLGGFAAYTNKKDFFESFDNIKLSNITISGGSKIGAFVGYMFLGANRVNNIAADHITLISESGETGGLIGRMDIYSGSGDCLIENSTASDVIILANNSSGSGFYEGGLIGIIRENPNFDNIPPVPNRSVKATDFPSVTIQSCNVLRGNIKGDSHIGGLIGYGNIMRGTAPFNIFVSLCNTNADATATQSNSGGLIGYAKSLQINQSFSTGTATALNGTSGGLIGYADSVNILDSYSTSVINGITSGGTIGKMDNSVITRCHSFGNVSGTTNGGGIAGGGTSTVSSSLVCGGTISASTVHRIIGDTTAMLYSNYALDSVTPVPSSPDPYGPEGGTLALADVESKIRSIGWDTSNVWNTSTLTTLKFPTLLKNPHK